MSGNRSYGSNFFTSSQSRKISIGIMVDSSARRIPGPVRDDEGSVPTEFGVDANKQDLPGGGVAAIDRARQNECQEHEGSPWITKRSNYKNSAGSESVLRAKLTGTKTDKNEMHSKANGLKGAPVDHSVQLFPKQASVLQSDHVSQKRFDDHKMNEERNEIAETVHKCASSTVRVALTSNGTTLGDRTGSKVKNQSESLRIKLRELLETVSSPNKEKSSWQPVEVGVTSLQSEQNLNRTVDTVAKPKQNSDTIENDSESPDCSNRRPVTRALTRKKASSKSRLKKLESGLLSSYKQKSKERNSFRFEEGHIGIRGTAKGSSSKVISNQKTGRKYARTDPRKLSFSSKNNQDENQRSTDRNKNSPSEERSSPHGYRRRSLLNVTLPVDIKPKKICREKDLPKQPAVSKPCQHEAINSPALANNKDQRECTGNTFPKVYVDQQDDSPSPTLQRTRMAGSSPSPLTQEDQVEQEAGNFVRGKGIFDKEDIFGFKSFHSRKLQDGSRVQSEAFEVAKELPDSPLRNAVLSKEKDVDHSSSESSSEEKESESSEEEGPHKEEAFSPETGVAEKLKFMLHRTKRQCSDGGIKSCDSDPASSSPKETGESNLLRHTVEENTEDGHARDFGLLALALEKLKSKLKSVTRKKSAEIMTSVTERIRVQLQTVESQIQSDMGKLKSLNKQKRKRLETEFQEQDEQLNLIHGNFIKEINRHLQSFKGTIEGLEKNKLQLAEVMEKQKASHKKLILQLEEAIGTQLHDAEKRISDMNKLAREQMLQLKLVMEKCLEGGLLS
ncbi:meiosis-specific protein ASY3 [Rhodamnia argentea]|uniref:Meiosis-specific protein ASY3 n=1 Tax=Rhodamnia argentea TaxID=178133 RepID=A0A8B8QX71_9MYRT|nr:meiosis-specific protein ASY3 [Rhodamnia argentea]XP_048138817.1 meiosis-specific protein ASY3 [Rhodamnia argentea]XP_048138818.1 meiosis-specific protein ASY3 [Rhodamnia argentea]